MFIHELRWIFYLTCWLWTVAAHVHVECPVDFAFLLDRSGNVCNNQPVQSCQSWTDAKQFLIALVDGMEVGNNATAARVALITFDKEARLQWNLDRYQNKDDLKRAIGGLNYEPNLETYTHEALALMMKEVFSSNHKNIGSRDSGDHAHVAVILTGGVPTHFDRTLQQVLETAAAGVKIFSIGITEAISADKLSQMSSYPHQLDKNYFTSPDYAHVSHLVDQVREGSCAFESIVDCAVDLALLLDRSGSICDNLNVPSCQNWLDAKDFLVKLIEGMEVGNGPNSARVALITFDSSASLRWNLDSYLNKDDLMHAIETLPYKPHQNTHTHEALDVMLKKVFGNRHENIGYRLDGKHRHVAVMLTDGLPTHYNQTLKLALEATSSGIKIFAVGVTRSDNTNMLRQISSPPHQLGQNYFTSADYSTVAMVVNQVRQETCRTIDPPSSTTVPPASRTVAPASPTDNTTPKNDLTTRAANPVAGGPNCSPCACQSFKWAVGVLSFLLALALVLLIWACCLLGGCCCLCCEDLTRRKCGYWLDQRRRENMNVHVIGENDQVIIIPEVSIISNPIKDKIKGYGRPQPCLYRSGMVCSCGYRYTYIGQQAVKLREGNVENGSYRNVMLERNTNSYSPGHLEKYYAGTKSQPYRPSRWYSRSNSTVVPTFDCKCERSKSTNYEVRVDRSTGFGLNESKRTGTERDSSINKTKSAEKDFDNLDEEYSL